ncbi:MAG: hypothetical protein KU29_06880, partial [Sulfurovum sp. FS06-10]
KSAGYLDVTFLDITDDVLLESLNVNEEDYLICVMDNHHLNVFLTLSLHNIFPKTMIVVLSELVERLVSSEEAFSFREMTL